MKVKALIELLNKFDGEMEVGVEDPHSYAYTRTITDVNVRDYADAGYLNDVFIEWNHENREER